MIFRYICIFHLKNPGAVVDDFWSKVLSKWVILFSYCIALANNFTAIAKEDKMTSICLGYDHQSDGTIPGKSNKAWVGYNIFSFSFIIIRVGLPALI